LEGLHGKFKLGVISNSMSQVPKVFLEQNKLAGYFDEIVISGAIGFRKPNPKIFNHALERLKTNPSANSAACSVDG
jgi:putative hydrolase of the HAD superfamily